MEERFSNFASCVCVCSGLTPTHKMVLLAMSLDVDEKDETYIPSHLYGLTETKLMKVMGFLKDKQLIKRPDKHENRYTLSFLSSREQQLAHDKLMGR